MKQNNLLDVKQTMEGYLGMSDWRVQENANVNYSLGGLILHNSGAVTANYWLNNVYSQEIADAHKRAAMHIHDLSMFAGYCAGWSLRQLISEGLGGVEGKISSAPARHLNTLVQQMVNFLGIMQNEWAGAQAFSSFDTYLSAFVRADGLGYQEVKQTLQSFIFGVNTPSRWGSQAPFTNITMDWSVPKDMAGLKAVVGEREMEFCYGELQPEMDMINKAFIELMIQGDASGRGFQYPIPTYNITRDFQWEGENAALLFEMTGKYGTPYFQNFINSDLNPEDVRSMCCRLQLDKRELRKRGGGLFGSDEFTGSIGVVTINLPQIAHLSSGRREFFFRLDYLMDLACRSLETKRDVVNGLMDQGLFPYTRRYLQSLDNHFATIGICGMNEAMLNFDGKDLTHPRAREFAVEILDHMRLRLSAYQERTGNLYNLEASPAEGASYRLALHDVKNHPGIRTGGTVENPYYTNSSQLPVDGSRDIFDALDAQDELQTRYTGGTVFHGFLGESIQDWRSCAQLIKTIAENYSLPYFTISPTFSVCSEHGYLDGERAECPVCQRETEVYSRIVGYYRSLKNWNAGKKQEFRERREYETAAIGATIRERRDPDQQKSSESQRTYSEKSPELSNTVAGTSSEELKLFLFQTPSCSRCPEVKSLLREAGIEYNAVDAASAEGTAHALKEGISTVPTLILKDSQGVQLWRGSDAGTIRRQLPAIRDALRNYSGTVRPTQTVPGNA